MDIQKALLACVVLVVSGCGSSDDKPAASTSADTVCSSQSSLNVMGKDGTWYVYGTPNGCATPTCTPTADHACAHLQSSTNAKGGLGVSFDPLLDLSAKSGLSFTADVRPVGARFDASVSSTGGVRGITWTLTAQSGTKTYEVAFADGYVWTLDSGTFDLAASAQFDVSNQFQSGGDLTVTLSGVEAW